MNNNQAIALKTNRGRWFYGYGKKKQVKTAFTLAGGRLFSLDKGKSQRELEQAENRMKAKGYKPTRVIIGELPVEIFHHQKTIFEELNTPTA